MFYSMILEVNLIGFCYFPHCPRTSNVGYLNCNCPIQSFSKNDSRIYHRRLTKNLRFPRSPKLPPEPYLIGLDTEKKESSSFLLDDTEDNLQNDDGNYNYSNENDGEEEIQWEKDDIEAISSLFERRIYQKPVNLSRQRLSTLPFSYKNQPLGLPTKKLFSRKSVVVSVGLQSVSNQLYKNPTFLTGIAKEVKMLPPFLTGIAKEVKMLPPEVDNVTVVLNKYARFLRKGSLSMTIRELGHMGLPERALQVFCWVKMQPHLFPDDRVLASTVEVLARSHKLKMLYGLDDNNFISLASRSVYEAMVRGFIKGGNLKMAWNLLSAAKDSSRVLDAGLYAKLILELGKNPDKETLVLSLLEELAARDDLCLTQQDCTAIMKICIRFQKFEIVQGLYDWFKNSGCRVPSIVMYTTLIHSRYTEKKYREAMAVVWEMEASNCLFDLPAYRVLIKLFVSLNDLQRAVRYFSKLKEAGFSPTFDLYRAMAEIYMASGRIAKCKEVCKEAEMAGIHFDICSLKLT